MAAQPPAIPANYGSFHIDQHDYVQLGPLIYQIAPEHNAQQLYTGVFQIRASGTQVWEVLTPLLTTIITATAAAQPGAPPPPPPPPPPRPKKVLAEKPPQFKGDQKEFEQWKKSLDMYLQAAREILTNNEEKILFTYSLM